jgi:integrase
LVDVEAGGSESAYAVAAIRLLLLTGCRLKEIQTLKWEHVFLDDAELRLPDSKSGPKTIHLGAPAVSILRTVRRVEDNPYVIVGFKEGHYLADLQHPWQEIRKRAGLEDVHIHDLRHSFASMAVSKGENLPMIGKLLGHTQVQTTARYAHLASDPVKKAADRVSTDLASAMQPRAANDNQRPEEVRVNVEE